MPSAKSPTTESPISESATRDAPGDVRVERPTFSQRMRQRWENTKVWTRRALRRLAYLLGPIVVTALLWFLIQALTNPGYAKQVLTAGGISLFGAGTVTVFGHAVFPEIKLTSWHLAFIVMWVNAASAFWYVYNLDLLERLPRIGPTLHRMRTEAVQTLEERPWIRRLSVVGVGAFVLTPLPGSGALGGAIVGRLIGVSRFASFISVSIAGVIVCIAYAMFANKLAKEIVEVPTWQRVLAALAVFGTIFLFMRWWTRRRMRDKPQASPGKVAVSTPNAK